MDVQQRMMTTTTNEGIETTAKEREGESFGEGTRRATTEKIVSWSWSAEEK